MPKPVEGILGSSLERPDGLQKELLAAIRRKISKSKENRTKETSQQSPNLTSVEDIEVSPASNAVGSTQQPPFFRPISFPNSQNGGRYKIIFFSCLDNTFPVHLFYQLYMQETANNLEGLRAC